MSSSKSLSSSSEKSGTSVNRTEVNVEIAGIRESHLTSTTSTKTVKSSTVRTVYGRTLSGSTSSTEDACAGEREGDAVFEDNQQHRTPTEVVAGGVWQCHRKTSESHFISQTYHLDTRGDSPSKSVTAIQNVTFKSKKKLDICTGTMASPHRKEGSGDAVAAGEQQQALRFIDRREEVIVADAPAVLGSPGYNTASQEFVLDYVPDSENKLKAAREDVQNMIESSYLVSDISDVIDDQRMNSKPQAVTKAKMESSVDAVPAKPKETVKAPPKSSGDWRSGESLKEAPATVQQAARASESLRMDKDSPRRPTYSPGLAIRSYALEELAEKKTKSESPDSLEKEAKSLRFDYNSSQVDPDVGSSVDDLAPNDPYLSSEFSHARSLSPYGVDPSLESCPMTEDERRESEDKLESLIDITSGYRFHDVGMMLGMGEGICNPAFDEADDQPMDQTDHAPASNAQERLFAQDVSSLQMAPTETATAVNAQPLMASSSSTCLQSTPSASLTAPSANSPLTHSESESRSNALPPATSSQLSQTSSSPSSSSVTMEQTKDKSLPNNSSTSSSSSSSAKPPTKATNVGPPVHITRHFNVSKKFESALKALGARLSEETLSVDVYYDTPSFQLTAADAWLRTRNGKWQFHANFCAMFEADDKKSETKSKPKSKSKSKSKSGKNNGPVPAARYTEKEEARAVLAGVAAILNSKSPSATKASANKQEAAAVHKSVLSYVHKSGLCEFARYTTTTRTYQLADNNMSVEVIMPEYGFWTGSVTSSAPCKAQTQLAVTSIDDLWKKTGVTGLSLIATSS